MLRDAKDTHIKTHVGLGERKSKFEDAFKNQNALYDEQINQFERTIVKNREVASSLVEMFEKLVVRGIEKIQ